MGILVVSTFWLLCIMLPWTFLYKFSSRCNAFIAVGHALRGGVAGSYGNPMFAFLRTCQTAFQSGCTISRSHQQLGGSRSVHILPDTWHSLWLLRSCIFLGESSLWLLCPFFYLGYLSFYWLTSSLCITGRSPLADTQSVGVTSHSVSRLFTFSVVFFEAQTVFILLKSS